MKKRFPTFAGRYKDIASAARLPSLNWPVLASMLILLVIGVFFVRSANAIRTDSVRYQYMLVIKWWIPLGLIVHFAVASIDYRKWTDYAWVFYLFAMAALVAVLFIGVEKLGAKRWLFGLQPSEFAKFAVVLMIVFFLARSTLTNDYGRLFSALAVAALPTVLVAVQPDLGTAFVLIPTVITIVFVAGCARRTLMVLCLAGILATGVLISLPILPEKIPEHSREKVEKIVNRIVFPHWKKRIEVFVYPDRDPLGAGWNKHQSEIAVGSGGMWGKGYLNGTQNILGFLPRAVSSTDFIYSVIAEETGFAGSLFLITLYGVLLAGICVTGFLCRDYTGQLICVGVAVQLFTHVFVNLAMTIGKMPITGIPLPLISYGGSFTISTMALLGLVQSVAIYGNKSTNGKIETQFKKGK